MSSFRTREHKGQLFSKKKRNLYDPTTGNEMVSLRSTSPEYDEAKKKELEASNEVENLSPVPEPLSVGEDTFSIHVACV